MEQHNLSPMVALSSFDCTTTVPVALVDDCEQKHREVLANSGRKATNLYRRVSTVSHQKNDTCKRRRKNDTSNTCIVCTVTLVKSSKELTRSGVKLKCPCNVRVCITCFHKSVWYEAEPHYSTCSIIRNFTCYICSLFHRVSVRRCCVWLCVECSEKDNRHSCISCSASFERDHRDETCELWGLHKQQTDQPPTTQPTITEENVVRYKQEIRRCALEKIEKTRHITNKDIALLFFDSTQPCTLCTDTVRDSMCVKCTPVTTVLELLGKNPRPLIASIAERIIPSRSLARHVYNKATLVSILNDPNVPFCINGINCKGMLLPSINKEGALKQPLRSLISPVVYNASVERCNQPSSSQHTASACIVCILFNQSATIRHMLNPDALYMEPEPREPVYYFNIKLSPDVGIPEIQVDDQHEFMINFQGSVGSYKPTYYYNWRDMLSCLCVKSDGSINILPCEK